MIWLKFHRHKAKEQKFGFAPGLKHCFPLEMGRFSFFWFCSYSSILFTRSGLQDKKASSQGAWRVMY